MVSGVEQCSGFVEKRHMFRLHAKQRSDATPLIETYSMRNSSGFYDMPPMDQFLQYKVQSK
jgi:hypothetical protein